MNLSSQLLKTACETALQTGKFLRTHAGRVETRRIHTKSANNFVTDMDRESERLIVRSIRKKFPGHNILGEEGGRHGLGNDFTWIIDPIDGTSNFIHGFPMFSISIGVTYKKKVIAGVVYDPSNQELFWASEKKGAFLNKKRIHVSRTRRLSDAIMATGIPFRGFKRFESYMDSFKNISLGSAGIRRGGSAALDLAHVACGRYDGYWEMGLSVWDIAAGVLLVTEAGGRVTDLRGKSSSLETGDVLAANRAIHRETLPHTKKIPKRLR